VGRSVRIGRHQVQIIGVAPRDFGGMMLVFEPDVWMPLKTMQALGTESMAGLANRDQRMFGCVGRLRPGVDAATANADVATLSAQLATAFPATDADRVAFLTPLR